MCEEESERVDEEEFCKGDRVSCNWYQDGDENQWYPSVVLSVDTESRTAHVKCTLPGDTEENTDMSWDWMMTLSE